MQILITSVEFAEEGGPEWVIVELQGDLESKTPEQRLSNKEIGDLHFSKEGNPILIIGHHILHGKITKCDKPFAVLEKNSHQTAAADQDNSTNKTVYKVKAIVRRKISFRERPKPIVSLHTSTNNQKTTDISTNLVPKVKVGANKKLDMDG